MNDLMSVKEASEFLHITPAHLAHLRYTGRGPSHYRPTRKTILYRRADLESWLDASRVLTDDMA